MVGDDAVVITRNHSYKVLQSMQAAGPCQLAIPRCVRVCIMYNSLRLYLYVNVFLWIRQKYRMLIMIWEAECAKAYHRSEGANG